MQNIILSEGIEIQFACLFAQVTWSKSKDIAFRCVRHCLASPEIEDVQSY